ncbi:TetR/AcrR family transcriptional regulator [Luteimonas sp. SDU101]|uniref:TetR/AcrR family transcriptional regulator n=1 Tax=unclassified Luteimonas TaxID=2629088 RepID=UPI003EBA85FB
MATSIPHRRERLREAALAEIRVIARRLLVEGGADAVTISAIARTMGMSAPALYRYYPSHRDLLAALASQLYGDLASRLALVREAAGSPASAAPLLAMCRALRAWASEHPAEFRFLFASPFLAEASDAGGAFGDLFLEEVARIWQRKPFPVPDARTLSPALRSQLRAYSERTRGRLPAAAIHVFLNGWVKLCGVLTMEVLGQLDFALTDVEPFYEQNLRELCAMLSLQYRVLENENSGVRS